MNALDRPSGMLCNQRLGISCYSFQDRQIAGIANIAQSNTDVSQKTTTLDSFNRGIAEQNPKLIVR